MSYCCVLTRTNERAPSICPVDMCGKYSKSKRGLDMHMSRMHGSVDLYWASKFLLFFLWLLRTVTDASD